MLLSTVLWHIIAITAGVIALVTAIMLYFIVSVGTEHESEHTKHINKGDKKHVESKTKP